MPTYRYGLMACAVVVSFHAADGFAQQDPAGQAAADLRFPRLVFYVGDDGKLRRRHTEQSCSDVGHIWNQLLKEPSVREELELLDDQRREFVAAARAAGGDPAKYRATAQNILLPHQLDTIRRLIGRYHCLARGVLSQLEAGEAFSKNRLTDAELQRLADRLARITKKYYATGSRELQVLDLEIRKKLTRAQLKAVHSLIGDEKVLEGPFLDFAILRLETIADLRGDRLDVGLPESAAVLGRSTQYQLAITGRLRPTEHETPMHFFAAFRNGINGAGLLLDADQHDVLADFEKDLISKVSGKSKRVYRLLTEGELTLDGAQTVLSGVAKREINRTISLFDTLLSRQQQDRLDEYVLRRDLAQRGMLPVLVEGDRIAIAEDQKKALLKIVERKLERYRELTRETETEIWDAVKYGLPPQQRKLWAEAYGDAPIKVLPVSPVLLLARPSSDR